MLAGTSCAACGASVVPGELLSDEHWPNTSTIIHMIKLVLVYQDWKFLEFILLNIKNIYEIIQKFVIDRPISNSKRTWLRRYGTVLKEWMLHNMIVIIKGSVLLFLRTRVVAQTREV